MPHVHYDVAIVGAGPAGLSAARTLARLGFNTIVVERAARPGEGHVCDAIVMPASGLVAGAPAVGGMYFPQLDLLIPESLVLARGVLQRCIAPSGEVFETLTNAPENPAALLDRPGLLRMLARQAETAGAEFRWSTVALGLVYQDEKVAGVRTADGQIRADLVLSSEGAARYLCEQAELYPALPPARRYALVVSQQLEAPAVGFRDLGRIVTLGHQHTSAQTGFGTLLMPALGRATMTYTLLVERMDCALAGSGWRYLSEYAQDPRIAGLLEGACVLQRSSSVVPMDEAPASVVRAGFVGLGDAVAPGGYLGILPAIFVGRQAALVAASALEDGDVSAASLEPFDAFYRTTILPGLHAEMQAMTELAAMDDDEIDRLCRALNALRLPLPFWLNSPHVAPETVAWLGQQLELEREDLDLVMRVLGGTGRAPGAATMPLFAGQDLFAG